MPVLPPNPPDLPLNALRAFETAARLGGFSAAALELGVSPGAVAAHVKSLEQKLGATLFIRRAQGVELTPIAAKVFPELRMAFDTLAQASRSLREVAQPSRVHIATLPCLAQLWLSPRLPGLRAASPDIAISITAMEQPTELKRSPYDLYLFYSTGAVTGGLGHKISGDEIFPVCSPEIAMNLRRVEDLAEVPCLSDATWDNDWKDWLGFVGARGMKVQGPVFSLYALAVEEALNGAGVLMGHGDLIAGHLATGRLVAPFPERVPLNRGLWLWSARPSHRKGTPIELVRDWLIRA